jgi:hypothetical protein
MSDSEIRNKPVSERPLRLDSAAQAISADAHTHPPGFTSAAQWGLASLLIGCTLVVAGCVTLVFNVLLFRSGPAGIPTGLAFAGGLIGALAVSALGVASLVFGLLGWQRAYADRSSPALGVAGTGASIAGLVTWLIATIDLIVILYSLAR